MNYVLRMIGVLFATNQYNFRCIILELMQQNEELFLKHIMACKL